MNRFVPIGFVLFALCHALDAASITRGPYLQNGTPTSVVVRWRTDTATDSLVRFGSAPGSLTQVIQNASLSTEHEITLGGLTRDSLYYYAVGSSAALLAGGDAEHYFITFPATGLPTRARVWVLGDAGTQDERQAAVRDAYQTFTSLPPKHTDLWLMLGDNAYQSGTDEEYQRAVFDMYPAMLRKSVLFSTLGNHDTGQSTAYTDPYPYFDIFTLPSDGEGGGVPSGTEHFYSFDFGNIHFICLDSMTADRATNGPMANWLRADLANTLGSWIVAFWHHPPYSRGSHNSDFEYELIEMRENFNPILESGGVDLVLSGHSHAYERSFLIDRHYGASASFSATNQIDAGSGTGAAAYRKPLAAAAHRGTVYSVAGSSGQTSGGFLDHPAMFLSLNVLGSVVLDFATNRLDFRFVDSTGNVRDQFSMIKGSGPSLPEPPAALTALAGNGHVSLAWQASENATSYKVKRGTSSGGPYFTIAPNVTATNYVDATTENGTTYFYVVSAVNDGGESNLNSTEASATPSADAPPDAPTGLVGTSTRRRKIDLTWTQSSSPNITQNKIYRAGRLAKRFRLLGTVPATTNYLSNRLFSGVRYRYQVTAIDSEGRESAPSNEILVRAR